MRTYTRLKHILFALFVYLPFVLMMKLFSFSDVDSSLALFRELYVNDPYRLDNWDVYSHLLYLKEKRMELANLAQRAVSIDKYRVETCCVIGKYP